MIEDFWNELHEGEIHVRDSLQFELKSEFSINPHLKQNVYKQEVFLFIPNPLQINTQTYSKQQFYLDQTNLIRYKTPVIQLSELVDPNNSFSPLTRLRKFLHHPKDQQNFEIASDELKLFAAIFRATVRGHVYQLIASMRTKSQNIDKLSRSIASLCTEISQVCSTFRQLQESSHGQLNKPQLFRYFKYVDEFISTMIDEFMAILLKDIRSLEKLETSSSIDKDICELILQEKLHRKKNNIGPHPSKEHSLANESILYRHGLLNRFVLEALMLKNYRFSLAEKHIHVLGAVAAGVAMFVYMIFFVWHISTFVIDSFPFVALAVLFYILKDRIKEGFKILYYKQAHRWFPDYSTEIRSPKGIKIGKLNESFTFIDPKQLPPGFLKIRNHHFHEELQALQRHETIIQYKREMTLSSSRSSEKSRRRELTAIFRLNIHRFLQKASDPFQANLTLNTDTQEITERLLPKVYHLNLIIRNTYLQADLTPKTEIKTFRVVVDKGGIKRVEHIKSK